MKRPNMQAPSERLQCIKSTTYENRRKNKICLYEFCTETRFGTVFCDRSMTNAILSESACSLAHTSCVVAVHRDSQMIELALGRLIVTSLRLPLRRTCGCGIDGRDLLHRLSGKTLALPLTYSTVCDAPSKDWITRIALLVVRCSFPSRGSEPRRSRTAA